MIVCGPKERFFAPCHSSSTALPEPTSVPVKLRISLPSAWKVMRATLVASVATALMVSVCTYFSLVPGALTVSAGGSKSPHGPLSWSPCVATERKASQAGLFEPSVRCRP